MKILKLSKELFRDFDLWNKGNTDKLYYSKKELIMNFSHKIKQCKVINLCFYYSMKTEEEHGHFLQTE